MNRFRSGLIPLFALLVLVACNSEPTGDLRNGPAELVAAPTQLFLEVGGIKTVEVGAVDAQGNALDFNYEVTSSGAGITVRRDSSFLPIFVDDSTLRAPAVGPRFRFIVQGTAYTATSFIVSAGGEDITIPVQVVPQNILEASFSTQTPGLGETVTITAPAGTRFSATSTVTGPDPAAFSQPFILSIAEDGSSMDVVLPPNLTEAQLTITDVVSESASSVLFAPRTALTVTTPVVPSFTGTYSTLTPAVNEAVTLTLSGATFDPATDLILGSGIPTITDLTTNSVTFIPAPGGVGLLVVNGVVLDALPQIPLSLAGAETDTMSVSADIPTIAGTGTPATAPTVITPALDRSSVLFDKPPYDGATIFDAYYRFVVTQEGLYTITVNWDIGDDIDLFLCPEAGVATFDCDFQAATGNHPEIGEYALTPGTYFIVADDFGPFIPAAPAVGTTLQINIDHAAPEPPAMAAARAKSAAAVRKTRK